MGEWAPPRLAVSSADVAPGAGLLAATWQIISCRLQLVWRCCLSAHLTDFSLVPSGVQGTSCHQPLWCILVPQFTCCCWPGAVASALAGWAPSAISDHQSHLLASCHHRCFPVTHYLWPLMYYGFLCIMRNVLIVLKIEYGFNYLSALFILRRFPKEDRMIFALPFEKQSSSKCWIFVARNNYK